MSKTKSKNKNKTSSSTKKSGKKILIVDDDQDILVSVGQILEKEGYEVVCAEGGKQCFEYLEAGEKPDLILLDIMMPLMSGWNVHEELKSKKDWKNIPIVFLTARGTDTAKEMCLKRGCGYIKKPFKVENLKEKVRDFLDKK
ncbi:MAG: response regulator transcription factor [Candidatus Thermoplasmatota archaeon]